jgi:hypothetical protein
MNASRALTFVIVPLRTGLTGTLGLSLRLSPVIARVRAPVIYNNTFIEAR